MSPGKIFIILVSGPPVWQIFFQKVTKHKNLNEMGRRGSKINISWEKMHHFFVPELMAAAVLVKTIVFDKFLMISVAVARKSTSL